MEEGSHEVSLLSGTQKGIPSHCLHRPSGKAVVRLNGHDHYFGPHGTEESRLAYDRLIAEWLVSGRRTECINDDGSKPSLSISHVFSVTTLP